MNPRLARRNAMDRVRFVRRAARAIEAAQVKRFGRSIVSLIFRTPVLVLATTGRRTGRTRETTLAYLRLEDDRLLLVGGAGGQSRVPDWVANLRQNPDVIVTIERSSRPMQAKELAGAQRQIALEQALRQWPRIRKYESRAGRLVPVILLSPLQGQRLVATPARSGRFGRKCASVETGATTQHV